MKHLLILRHAEAVPGGEAASDPRRALSETGREHARTLGELMRRRGIAVERIVSSSAERARETAEAVMAGGGFEVPLDLSDRLYNASGERLLGFLQGMSPDVERVLLVAHVPGVAELVSMLTTEHVDLAMVYRPCTLVEIETEEAHWADLDYGVGILRMMLPPPATA